LKKLPNFCLCGNDEVLTVGFCLAIAFCQKLADPDLGIHIAWITNQPLEQPLKPIQPDPPKLISKIQSWIDEIV
jgi:hypothetical protein